MTDSAAVEQMNTSMSPEDLAAYLNEHALGAFMEYHGLRFVSASRDSVEATWQVTPQVHQPYGLAHGGAHCAVIETLASVAAMNWLGPENGRVVGVNNNTDFYRGVSEGELRSTSTPIHRGRLQQVWQVETHDDQGRLVARGQVRLQNLYPQG